MKKIFFIILLLSNVALASTINIPNLEGPVSVYIDKYGVPHITAEKSDLDAFKVLGYFHARDRLWQMEVQRHVTKGTLSEMFGKATVNQDKYLRTWGFYRASQQDWPLLSKDSQAILQAYADGVNAFLTAHPHLYQYPMQFWFVQYKPEPWTAIDSIAWQKLIAWDLETHWQTKISNYLLAKKYGVEMLPILKPPYPADAPTILNAADLAATEAHEAIINSASNTSTNNYSASMQGTLQTAAHIRQQLNFQDTPEKGSNNWVISGRLTTTGKPFLANDPHLALQAPALWYLTELTGPTLHVTGATIPGMPLIVIGHNDHIAWGFTNSEADNQDIFIETAPISERDEIIKIKGEADLHIRVLMGKHGPIISEVSDDAKKVGAYISLQWPALMPGDTTAESFLEINYAKNWEEFTGALRHFVSPMQNIVYADTAGNIGYYLTGRMPIRKNYTGEFPVEANQPYDWDGFIEFEKMPQVLNPAVGYIASANNKIVPDTYPYLLNSRWPVPPYRINRIEALLKQQGKLSLDDMKKIQLDTLDNLWMDLRDLLLQTIELDEPSKQALQLLKDWDGNISVDSIPGSIFAYWYHGIDQMIPRDAKIGMSFSEPLFIKQQLLSNGKFCQIDHYQSCAELLSGTLQQAIQKLSASRGSNQNKWQWGKIHRAQFIEMILGHVKYLGWIWNRHIATPGGLYSVNVGTYNDQFQQTNGAGYRQIVDLGDLSQSIYIQSVGQSDRLTSSHYADLMPLWARGEYISMNAPAVEEINFKSGD